jgi:hypothetical protein
VVDKAKDSKFDFVGDASPNTVPPPKPDGVKVMSIETAGVLVDSTGHTWTIPEKDETDVRYKSQFTIPRPDPLMMYQFIRKDDELTEYMGNQWVPVTREEIGVATFKSEGDEYGSPLDKYHVIGTQICVKKPKVLVEREYKALKRVCDAAVSATEPPPPKKGEEDVRNGAQYNRGQRRYTLDRREEKVSPKNAENEQVSGIE